MQIIENADECTRKSMLAWVYYSYSSNSCYVYPRYVLVDNEWRMIDEYAFPNSGAFQGLIRGGATPSDLREQYGEFVVATVNKDEFPGNEWYEPEDQTSNMFRVAINPSFSKGTSELEFDKFSNNILSTELVQLVTLQGPASLQKPTEKPFQLETPSEDLCTTTILAKSSTGDKNTYYGPFEYSNDINGQITLKALRDNDFRITSFNLEDVPKMDITNKEGSSLRVLVDRHILDDYFKTTPKANLLDWIGRIDLVDMISHVINASDGLNAYTKAQKRDIKNAIRESAEHVTKDYIDDGRIQRFQDILAEYDKIVDLPDQITEGLLSKIDDEKLGEIVLQNFNSIKERVLNVAGVAKEVEAEKEKQIKDLENNKAELDSINLQIEEARRIVEEENEKAEKAKEQAEKVRTEALEQRREELESLNRQVEEAEIRANEAKAEYERRIADKNQIEDAVNSIINGINNEVETSKKILESEILRKVVAAVNGVDLTEEIEESQKLNVNLLKLNENDMSDNDIVDELFDAITVRAGRQMTRNDVVNLMICLTQGYITTFAGLPGTGKTSLSHILAGALGLENSDLGPRFTEINVENGWTSYKDYIGYYNPLAKVYEKSNATVYDAMRRLSHEEVENDKIPPYLFLLDEANLSPIEHYWAPFLRACDSFKEDGTVLNLGGNESWILPCYTRFLATVNFDHTTEALSHRFLDRSWVITLESDFLETNTESVYKPSEFKNNLAYSAHRLTNAFGVRSGEVLNTDANDLLDDLLRTCKSEAFSVSPRSIIMIKNYISAATVLMNTQSKDSMFAPIDYAFSQKVLPQISGTADRVGSLVEKLLEKSSKLKNTERQLSKMKKNGEDSGFYQYFI